MTKSYGKRVWDEFDAEAEAAGKAINMIRKIGRPTADASTGGRHTTRARNRRTTVANGRRNQTMGELGVIY